ncbi:MAG: Crp/Fnr family transcriptional regulator [Candidatus Tectimicrobiota bacterium]|nr:MAG: Crp/Fnr family transcriptional regulator [Candidatus Tectomicrobia bacterium]
MDPAELPVPPDFLQQVRFFQGLSEAEAAAVLDAAWPRRVARDGFFFHQHDTATTLYVLRQGQVKLSQLTPEGHQVLLRYVGPGEMFGGIAVLAQSAYPVSAQAVEDSLALAWDGERMARLMERYPRLALNALRLVAARFRELQDRYRELATERVERRVARALLRLARHRGRKVPAGVLIDLPLSRQDLAELTGTTLYTVSRLLSRWDQQGLLHAGRERVLIRTPHELERIAEDLPPSAPLPPAGE